MEAPPLLEVPPPPAQPDDDMQGAAAAFGSSMGLALMLTMLSGIATGVGM